MNSILSSSHRLPGWARSRIDKMRCFFSEGGRGLVSPSACLVNWDEVC